jgi:hypothetical protein
MEGMPSPRASILFTLLLATSAHAQHVVAPHASVVDVSARQAFLAKTTDPVLRAAISGLRSCVATPLVSAPTGPIDIPHHYLVGSHGPTNPAEAAATRVYGEFERRITAGMSPQAATPNRNVPSPNSTPGRRPRRCSTTTPKSPPRPGFRSSGRSAPPASPTPFWSTTPPSTPPSRSALLPGSTPPPTNSSRLKSPTRSATTIITGALSPPSRSVSLPVTTHSSTSASTPSSKPSASSTTVAPSL